jgi:toxin-antitoxin system PIN domain toxin
MPSLCDVNFLLAICHRRHTIHAIAARWLDSVDDDELIVCRFSQLALLRLLNNPVTMQGQPLNADQAWRDYDTVMSDERFAYRSEPEDLETVLRRLMRGQHYAPKLWPDAYLAAFAIAAGLQFVTFDQGFRKFAGLQLELLGHAS